MLKKTLIKNITFKRKYLRQKEMSCTCKINVSVLGNRLVDGYLIQPDIFYSAFQKVTEALDGKYLYNTTDADVDKGLKNLVSIAREDPTTERIAFEVYNRMKPLLNGPKISVEVVVNDIEAAYCDFDEMKTID